MFICSRIRPALFLRPLLFVCLSSHPLWATADQPADRGDGSIAGVSWVGPAGVRERTGDIMEREARQVGKKSAYRQRVRRTIELVERAEDTELPSPMPPPGGSTPEVTGTGQNIGLSFLGATLADTHSYPPDSMGAIGPSQYIVAVNGRVRSFDKQ